MNRNPSPFPNLSSIQPPLPTELWLLWDAGTQEWVMPINECGNPLMCFVTQADADKAAEHVMSVVDTECRPVRVKC